MRMHERFKDAIWYKFSKERAIIHIGGAGGISSWLALLLARNGYKLIVQDFDRVEDINLAGQFFSVNNIGDLKVLALQKNIELFANNKIITVPEKLDKKTAVSMYCFSGFDNMKARKNMFDNWCENYYNNLPEITPIFIDGRLNAEFLEIYCVNSLDRIKRYKETLFDDKEANPGVCTLKQTTHCATMIASFMVSFFNNHITNCYNKDDIKEVPFKFQIFLPLNTIEYEQ